MPGWIEDDGLVDEVLDFVISSLYFCQCFLACAFLIKTQIKTQGLYGEEARAYRTQKLFLLGISITTFRTTAPQLSHIPSIISL